ncbi:hypothetical protein MC885_001175 [Smutsia gigantea]|nr:hypothetical protein MC885_001175 [Smutsia gigantea]
MDSQVSEPVTVWLMVNTERNLTLYLMVRKYKFDFSYVPSQMFITPFAVSLVSFLLFTLSFGVTSGRWRVQVLEILAQRPMYYLSNIMTNVAYLILDSLGAKIFANVLCCSVGRPLMLQEGNPVLTRIWMLTKHLSVRFPTCLLPFAPEDRQFFLLPFLGNLSDMDNNYGWNCKDILSRLYSSGNLIEYISYLCVIINQSSVWFAPSLSIFYFLKTANFSHHIFSLVEGRKTAVYFCHDNHSRLSLGPLIYPNSREQQVTAGLFEDTAAIQVLGQSDAAQSSTDINIFLIIVTGEFIIRMLRNVCIGLIHWIDWIKKTKISSADYIFTSSAISLISLLNVMILDGIILVLYPDFLKRIDRVVPWVLLGSLTVSSLISLTLAMTVMTVGFIQLQYIRGTSLKRSIPQYRGPYGSPENRDFISLPPFYILWGFSFGDFSYLMKESKLAIMFGEIIAILYSSGHSLILIIGNNKQRRHLPGCRDTDCNKREKENYSKVQEVGNDIQRHQFN